MTTVSASTNTESDDRRSPRDNRFVHRAISVVSTHLVAVAKLLICFGIALVAAINVANAINSNAPSWLLAVLEVVDQIGELLGLNSEVRTLTPSQVTAAHGNIGTGGATLLLLAIKKSAPLLSKTLRSYPKLAAADLLRYTFTIFFVTVGLALTATGGQSAIDSAVASGNDEIRHHIWRFVDDNPRPLWQIDIPLLSAANLRTIDSGKGPAIKNPAFADSLKMAGEALQKCVSDSSTGPRVKIAISGFASSSEWNAQSTGEERSQKLNSDQLAYMNQFHRNVAELKDAGYARTKAEAVNLQLARLRATALLEQLFPNLDGHAPSEIDVQNRTLNRSLSEIASEYPLLDLGSKGEEHLTAVFTRTARLELISAGKCDRKLRTKN